VTGRTPSASLAERAELLRRAGEVGRPHGVLMAELLDLGQASPSDAALLRRLGLSRARVTALLRELLTHGLVESTPDADPATSGRPRTIYRPRLTAGVR
jgi:DNA-binding MarR family transcriptional regulator